MIENENFENKETDEIENNDKLSKLIAQRVNLQLTIAKLTTIESLRKSHLQVSEKVSKLKDTIVEGAHNYGQNVSKIREQYDLNNEEKSNILKDYKICLNITNTHYDNNMKNLQEEIKELEKEERDLLENKRKLQAEKVSVKKSFEYKEYSSKLRKLKSEMKADIENDDFDALEEKKIKLKNLKNENPVKDIIDDCEQVKIDIENCRNDIENAYKEMEQSENNRQRDLNAMAMTKEKSLAKIQKQNIFQKMVGAISNRFTGAKKFNNQVIGEI